MSQPDILFSEQIYPVIVQYGISNDGMCTVSINIKTEENGKTEQERWLYAAKQFRNMAEIIEKKWK